MIKTEFEETKPPASLADAVDTPHPLIYADQLSSLAIGPFVSKMTVAIENHAVGARVPVVTIVMPTNTLHQLATQINLALSDRGAVENLKKVVEQYVQAIDVVDEA